MVGASCWASYSMFFVFVGLCGEPLGIPVVITGGTSLPRGTENHWDPSRDNRVPLHGGVSMWSILLCEGGGLGSGLGLGLGLGSVVLRVGLPRGECWSSTVYPVEVQLTDR